MLEIIFVFISLFCGGVKLAPGEVVIRGKHPVVVSYPRPAEPQPESVVTYPGNGN